MKKVIYPLSAGLVLFFLAYIVLSGVSLFPKPSIAKDDSPSRVIDAFWQNSLQGNANEIEKLTSETPKDFFAMKNKCAEEKGDTLKKIESSKDSLVQVSESVSDDLTKQNVKFIAKTSSYIKEGGYVHHKVVEEKIAGNHALLRVAYGKDELMRYQDIYLLNKENNEWKLFMITTDWELKLINKDYILSDCLEN